MNCWCLRQERWGRFCARKFDLVLGLDMSRDSGALCALAHAADKRGFSLDTAGALFPLNKAAEEWFYMGLDDGLKKREHEIIPADTSGTVRPSGRKPSSSPVLCN